MSSKSAKTLEELQALPEFSVVRARGIVYEKDVEAGWEDRVWWAIANDRPLSAQDIDLPARVLFIPQPGNLVTGDKYSTGNHQPIDQYDNGFIVCDTCVNCLGLNIRWDQASLRPGHAS